MVGGDLIRTWALTWQNIVVDDHRLTLFVSLWQN